MSKISTLLSQILSAVYGKDVRQSIHDSIEQCYSDVSEGKTIADTAAENANTAAVQAKTDAEDAVSTMTTKTNAAIADCNSAASTATTAAATANAKTQELTQAFADLGLKCVDGKLCVKVERE